ncbi:hypothetical protein OGH69_11235 [Flavobacterium sp. MFBS3-15]|uniref:hypothetical protein n=1 Tax=Flavobacterium sp. MFBS3-15 TaxID=2989816 RepID=UPI00223655BD|nr:hypothetical protein [Flavobacterium sp. MFBS3-15]MCW4469542.1 hypothetical protein [Flavobacterium sp. MFBS3-15]
MEMRFETKEESNRRREEEFLKLSGGERVMRFLKLSMQMRMFPTTAKPDKSSNFVLEMPKKNATGLE